MTPRTPQCEVFWSFKSSSEFSGVPEDSNPKFFQVLGFTPTLGQSRVATLFVFAFFFSWEWHNRFEFSDGMGYLLWVLFFFDGNVHHVV
jgi:hypothetical protein